MDQIDLLIKYEQGELESADIMELFSGLIKSGLAWTLQGSYGRTAAKLIEIGYISEQGEILVVEY